MRVGQLLPFSGIPGRLQPWNSYACLDYTEAVMEPIFVPSSKQHKSGEGLHNSRAFFVSLALLPPPPRAPDTMVTLLPRWGGWVVSRSHWDNSLGQQMVIILHYTLGTRAYWLDWWNPTQHFGAFLGLPSSVHGLQKQSAALMDVRKWWWI